MSLITTSTLEGDITKISLQVGKGNPLTPQVLKDLLEILQKLSDHPPQAVLLDAPDSKIFSGGFALPIIASFEREALHDFLSTFMLCLDHLLRLPCPSICAVDGHAVAGGFILSLATDFRVVTRAPIKLGLPEVNLGMPVPAGAQALFIARSSEAFAHHYCCTGELFTPEEGYRIGYASQLADDVNAAALQLAQQLAAKPAQGLKIGRNFMNRALADRVQAADQAYMSAFLDAWFLPEAQTYIQAQAQKLSKR